MRVDRREDGFVRTSNVTKFLAASSGAGLPADTLFRRDDLLEASSESLARVARTVLALARRAEFPGAPPDRTKVLHGGGGGGGVSASGGGGGGRLGQSPYGQNGRAAAASTPNLSMSQLQRSTSPVNIHTSKAPSGSASPVTARKRWSPHQHLPTVRSDSPNEDSSDGRTVNNDFDGDGDDVFGGALNPVSGKTKTKTNFKTGSSPDRELPPPAVPPRSPLRIRPVVERISIADSTRASMGDSIIGSFAESFAGDVPHTPASPASPMRQSQASSNMTDLTAFSGLSLLDAHGHGKPPRSPGSQTRFGTIRTITTDATSEAPSLSRGEGSALAASFKEREREREDSGRRRSIESPVRPVRERERRPSETAVVDLTRVVEETEDSATSKSRSDKSDATGARAPRGQQPIPIKLGKGKWPDDFLGLDNGSSFHAPRSSALDDDDFDSLLNASSSSMHTPLSISPPRSKLVPASPSARTPGASVESLPQFPRRPTHRARHSVDAPGGLLPKELLPRDASPDAPGSGSPPRRIMIRRSSSRAPQGNRNGVYIPRQDGSASPEGSDGPVPFPRTVSGEHAPHNANGSGSGGLAFPSASASPDGSKVDLLPGSGTNAGDRPRLPRGRFQSEVDSASARRKPRPNSYDEYGARAARRSRFESMVNLGGVGPSNASASDLMSRDSLDGSTVRQTLIVREDGKAPTQFVSRPGFMCAFTPPLPFRSPFISPAPHPLPPCSPHHFIFITVPLRSFRY